MRTIEQIIEDEEAKCSTCKHYNNHANEMPCKKCIGRMNEARNYDPKDREKAIRMGYIERDSL